MLLDGVGVTSTLSRAAQSGSSFSHVGLVIGSDLYIDAVRKDGVCVRRISDIANPKQHYDLNRCKVARDKQVIATQVPIWPQAIEYYHRPYALWSVFMKPGGAAVEDDPVICSKLVATILADIGFDMPLHVQRTMPKHLAEMCQGGEWKQFPLKDYDVSANSTSISKERKGYTDYWLDMVGPLNSVSRKFRAVTKVGRKKRRRE